MELYKQHSQTEAQDVRAAQSPDPRQGGLRTHYHENARGRSQRSDQETMVRAGTIRDTRSPHAIEGQEYSN